MNYILSLVLSCVMATNLNVVKGSLDVLRVTTVINEPFVVLKGERRENLQLNLSTITNDDFDGYMIDLLNALAAKVQFDYKISVAKDSAYGYIANGNWNGMVGEIIRGEADLAVADLTITSPREEVVEFSYPFMTTGIGLLAKRPPYYDCEMKETSSISTNNCSIRIYPVNNLNDLLNQNVVQYGALESGSTAAFFKNTKVAFHSKLGEKLQLSKTNREGIDNVRNSNGDFMLFMNTAAVEYLSAKYCEFIQFGPNIAKHGYGIAMRPNYHLRTKISVTLLEMQESGKLQELKKKWWPNEKQCDTHLDAVYAKNALKVVLDTIK